MWRLRFGFHILERRPLRHFATVLVVIPYSRLSAESQACGRCIAARSMCVVVALPSRTSPVWLPSFRSHERIAPSNLGIQHLGEMCCHRSGSPATTLVETKETNLWLGSVTREWLIIAA